MNIHIVLWKITFYRLLDTSIAEKRITNRNSTVMEEEAVGLLYTQMLAPRRPTKLRGILRQRTVIYRYLFCM
jgi:hypothetical protein